MTKYYEAKEYVWMNTVCITTSLIWQKGFNLGKFIYYVYRRSCKAIISSILRPILSMKNAAKIGLCGCACQPVYDKHYLKVLSSVVDFIWINEAP